jgi:glycosyltransferase involved in cell wall biosynthesis
MTLPARKWKWRMRLAAPYFAERLANSQQRYDRILCSTFVDVAAFRGLAPAWVRSVPVLTYFHENQFVYPMQVEDERDFHFALTNVTTALASDSVAFNSRYNLISFLEGMQTLLKQGADLSLQDPCRQIEEKGRVLPPGVAFSEIDGTPRSGRNQAPVILWNHRWEHDKDPERFFEVLFELDRAEVDFNLVVLGQSYQRQPAIFAAGRERLAHRLLQFGYVRSRRDYVQWLKRSDLVVSTAKHEFFGIAVLEAVRAGCRPLLPARLSYPEIFPAEYLYEEADFAERLREVLTAQPRLAPEEAVTLTEPFAWPTLAPNYLSWLQEVET